MKEIRKIVVVGPESTGKSTLCEKLAAHYDTIWVKEYAREYLLKNGTDYTFENLLDVAKGQLRLEEESIQELTAKLKSSPAQKPLLFIDTDQYVMKTWCEFVFGKCHRLVLDEIVKRNYDLYLLCNTDLPWVKDELREYPDLESRRQLYNIYKDIMINQPVPWAVISGTHEERAQAAIKAIHELLK